MAREGTPGVSYVTGRQGFTDLSADVCTNGSGGFFFFASVQHT